MIPDLIVIHEHPEWQKPLFAALERRGLSFAAYDLKRNAFDPARLPRAAVLQSGEPQRIHPRQYPRGAPRVVADAVARGWRRPRPQRFTRLRFGVKQERSIG